MQSLAVFYVEQVSLNRHSARKIVNDSCNFDKLNLQDSLNRIASLVGTRYDGRVVQALIEACNDGQIGIGIVKLREEARNSDRKLVSAREQIGKQAA